MTIDIEQLSAQERGQRLLVAALDVCASGRQTASPSLCAEARDQLQALHERLTLRTDEAVTASKKLAAAEAKCEALQTKCDNLENLLDSETHTKECREHRIEELYEQNRKLREALEKAAGYIEGSLEDGCPRCGGDCASENPAPTYCPMKIMADDLKEARAALAEGGEL